MLVTNPVRVAKAIKEKTCNALLLKVNQIGSVTESIEAVGMAKAAGWGVMTSHRCVALFCINRLYGHCCLCCLVVVAGLARRRTPSLPTWRWA